SFTKSPKEKLRALNFAQMPVAGDLVDSQKGCYRVKAIIHRSSAGLDGDATVSVLLEPIDSFVI
ncbi:MAG: hypothetical protein AAB018_06175, partial [Actinomycetota bacterium]